MGLSLGLTNTLSTLENAPHILLLLGGVFCIYMLGLVGSYVVESSVSLLIFCLVVLSIIEGRVLKSPTTIVELAVSAFNSVNVCFIHFGILLLGVNYVYNSYILFMNLSF